MRPGIRPRKQPQQPRKYRRINQHWQKAYDQMEAEMRVRWIEALALTIYKLLPDETRDKEQTETPKPDGTPLVHAVGKVNPSDH